MNKQTEINVANRQIYLGAMADINMSLQKKLDIARDYVQALEGDLETSTDNVMKLSAKIDGLSEKMEMFMGRLHDPKKI